MYEYLWKKPENGIHKTPIPPYLPLIQILTHSLTQEGSPTAIRTISEGNHQQSTASLSQQRKAHQYSLAINFSEQGFIQKEERI